MTDIDGLLEDAGAANLNTEPRIFLTADLHFHHKGIIRMCRSHWAPSVEQMNARLVQAWNHHVKLFDTVYVLGDLSFAGLERTVEILVQLNGHIKLVPGNHDDPQMLRKLQERGHIEVLPELYYLKVGGTRNVLCHYPLESWRSMQYGSYHFHGHSHGNLRDRGRRMDVGVDAVSRAPQTLTSLQDKLNTSIYTVVDHHTQQY